MLGATQPGSAVSYTSVHDFNPYPQGAEPKGGLLLASDGNYYGITAQGGDYGFGTVFRIDSAGGWSTLYSFSGYADGSAPTGPLIQGPDGALYGVTTSGGSQFNSGEIFKFVPGTGALTILHAFGGLGDVQKVSGALVFGSDGAFYGTGSYLVGNTVGLVFRCTTGGGYTLIHSFSSVEGQPNPAALFSAGDGNLYGTTQGGGMHNDGILYKMTTSGVLTKLHDFAYQDGYGTYAPLMQGADGLLWGTTNNGAASHIGTIYKIATDGSGFSVVHSFSISEGDGVQGPLVLEPDGNYYGSANTGGLHGEGSIFSITPGGVFSVVHSFYPAEQLLSIGGVIAGGDGLLWGTAESGGAHNTGAVFKIAADGTVDTVASCSVLDGAYPSADVVLAGDGNYYGMTPNGGVYNFGTVYRLTPGGVITDLHDFTPTDSNENLGLTLGPDGNVYGVGFRINPTDGYQAIKPSVNVSLSNITLGRDGKLYGADGTLVYTITTAGVVTPIATLPAGEYLYRVVMAGDGNLYGVITGGAGAIVRITPSGSVSTAYTFTGGADGSSPFQNLFVGPDGNLYGVSINSLSNNGIVYRLRTNGAFEILSTAPLNSGWWLSSPVIVSNDGTIYGVAGSSASSFVYSISTSGVFSKFLDLPSNVSETGVRLDLGADGSIFGTSFAGGAHRAGALFTLTAVSLSQFTVSSPTPAGGSSITGTVALSGPALADGRVVTITSNNAAVTVSSPVTVPAGATSATFTINTAAVAADTPVTLTATSGGVAKTASLTVKAPILTALLAVPNPVVGGNPYVVQARISSAAPTGGITVAVSSNSTSAAAGSVTIPAGATSATVTFATTGVNASTSITLTGTLRSVTKTATLTVNPAALSQLVVPSYAYGGTTAYLTVYINGKAGSSGATVSLSSSDGKTIPAGATVKIQANAGSASYAFYPASTATDTPVSITATLGTVTLTGSVLVKAPAVSIVQASPASVVGGQNMQIIVRLTGPAPTGGTVVALSSTSSAVPASSVTLTVPAGSANGSCVVTTTGVDSSTPVTLTATTGSVSKTAAMTVVPASLPAMTVPASVYGGTTTYLSLYLNGRAGPSGVNVNLSSSDGTTIPAGTTFTIPAGANYGRAAVSPAVTLLDKTITVTAAQGSTTRSGNLQIKAAVLLQLLSNVNTVTSGQSVNLQARLTSPAPAGGLTVHLSSSNTSAIPVSSVSFVIAAGATSGTVTVPVGTVDVSAPVTLTGTAGSVSMPVSFTVIPAVLSTLSVPASVKGGTATGIAVYLTGKAGPSGVTVTLSSSDGTTIPAGTLLKVPSGASSASYSFTPAKMISDTSVTITATEGDLTKTGVLLIKA